MMLQAHNWYWRAESNHLLTAHNRATHPEVLTPAQTFVVPCDGLEPPRPKAPDDDIDFLRGL